MATSEPDEQVAYVYEDIGAPTGEGTVLVTGRGQWRRCFSMPVISGMMYGELRDGFVRPLAEW